MEVENPRSNEQNHKVSYRYAPSGTIPDGPGDLSRLLNHEKEQEFALLCISMHAYDWANDNVYQASYLQYSSSPVSF